MQFQKLTNTQQLQHAERFTMHEVGHFQYSRQEIAYLPLIGWQETPLSIMIQSRRQQTGLTTAPRSMLASPPVDWRVWIGSCVLLPA